MDDRVTGMRSSGNQSDLERESNGGEDEQEWQGRPQGPY